MNDYACYSTKDMVNWTDHGIVLHVDDFGWALENRAWAPQCVERDGRFYMYTPLVKKPWTTCIGVSVADSPIGPFVPYGDTFLVTAGDGDIDPTVFIDDDGQAYLYWGNPRLYCVKLNEDMVSYDTSVGNNGIISFEMTTEAFGTRDEVKDDYPSDYEEGPWFYKRNGLYYLIYGAGGIPERLSYSTSKNPLGPWKYGGVIMDDQRGSFTNHPGIVDFMGRSYLFYHTGNLPGGGGFKRSICVEEFEYNEDGSIPKIPMTSEGPDAIDTLNRSEERRVGKEC